MSQNQTGVASIEVLLRDIVIRDILLQQKKGKYHVNLSLIRQYEAEMLPPDFNLSLVEKEEEGTQILTPTQLLAVYFSLYKKGEANPITTFLEQTGFKLTKKPGTDDKWWSVSKNLLCDFDGRWVACFLSLDDHGSIESMHIDFLPKTEPVEGFVCCVE